MKFLRIIFMAAILLTLAFVSVQKAHAEGRLGINAGLGAFTGNSYGVNIEYSREHLSLSGGIGYVSGIGCDNGSLTTWSAGAKLYRTTRKSSPYLGVAYGPAVRYSSCTVGGTLIAEDVYNAVSGIVGYRWLYGKNKKGSFSLGAGAFILAEEVSGRIRDDREVYDIGVSLDLLFGYAF